MPYLREPDRAVLAACYLPNCWCRIKASPQVIFFVVDSCVSVVWHVRSVAENTSLFLLNFPILQARARAASEVMPPARNSMPGTALKKLPSPPPPALGQLPGIPGQGSGKGVPTYPRRPAGKECSCGFLLARRARSGDVPAAPYRLTQPRYGEEVARAGRREDEGLPFLIAVRHRGPADRLQAVRRLLIRYLVGRRVRRGNPVRILVRHRNVRGRMGGRIPGRARRTPLGTDAPRRG